MKTENQQSAACFAFLLLVSILSSCTVYVPQAVPIPLMTYKKEVQASGGITFIPGLTGAFSYSPFNRVATQLYAFSSLGSVQYSQAALGYYSRYKEWFNYEMYGGAGFGKGNYYKTSGDKTVGEIRGDYSLLFVQANAGRTFEHKAKVDYGLGFRTGLLNAQLFNEMNEMAHYNYHSKMLVLEPAAFIRTGGKLKVSLQANYGGVVKIDHKNELFPHEKLSVSLIVGYHFPAPE